MYIVLLSNSSNQVVAMGTATGRPFQSERSAERAAKRVNKAQPNLNTLVLEIMEEAQ